jgi:beta-lactam-binding protein with PASTA domain
VTVTLAALLLGLVAGCGAGESHPAPDLVGQRLDVAQEHLDDLGLGYETIGGGAFGIVVSSNWTVCEQEPAPGRRTSRVQLVVDRWCPQPPPPPPVVPNVVDLPYLDAEARLARRGIEAVEHWIGPGSVYDAAVCRQTPHPGSRAWSVTLELAELCPV